MANLIGKRYVCASCGSEMLVTRPGAGTLQCCGQPMQLRGTTAAKPQPQQQVPQEVKRG